MGFRALYLAPVYGHRRAKLVHLKHSHHIIESSDDQLIHKKKQSTQRRMTTKKTVGKVTDQKRATLPTQLCFFRPFLPVSGQGKASALPPALPLYRFRARDLAQKVLLLCSFAPYINDHREDGTVDLLFSHCTVMLPVSVLYLTIYYCLSH